MARTVKPCDATCFMDSLMSFWRMMPANSSSSALRLRMLSVAPSASFSTPGSSALLVPFLPSILSVSVAKPRGIARCDLCARAPPTGSICRAVITLSAGEDRAGRIVAARARAAPDLKIIITFFCLIPKCVLYCFCACSTCLLGPGERGQDDCSGGSNHERDSGSLREHARLHHSLRQVRVSSLERHESGCQNTRGCCGADEYERVPGPFARREDILGRRGVHDKASLRGSRSHERRIGSRSCVA
mmetsp:Transcript_4782/g.19650  ORF Transcript_4782/g.19650 Transcript_4782/m.19650 type:complete len:245 (+) Transcript_4782:2655-3389(+)